MTLSREPDTTISETCVDCGRELPLDEFPFRVRGQPARRGNCRRCRAGYMRHYRAGKRAKTVKQLSAAMTQVANRSKMETAFVVAIRKFGGVRGFAREWWDQFVAASVQAPGSWRSVRLLETLARLGEVTQTKRPADDYGLLSDEDLAREQQQALLEFVAANPEVALWAARQVGCKVIPHDESIKPDVNDCRTDTQDLGGRPTPPSHDR